ncbi:fimbrial protein [Pseudomonas sp. TNT2022 ID233]|uniref:fimbrial protein n=1 Tax=Pseudomonas aphyarum TaxID=2942629 RepID=UPI0023612012|nr:fimbrial protein [Pseudomonas aphyarum]MDD1141014.1 fimbrial protein [Pseudomonas aphyarum]
MKLRAVILTTIHLFLHNEFAHADNPNKCSSSRWGYETATHTINLPGTIVLRKANIGSTMYSNTKDLTISLVSMSCPYNTVKQLYISREVKGAELVDGYSNVYKTGLAGVGIMIVGSNPSMKVPSKYELTNGVGVGPYMIQLMSYVLIRTSRDVAQGEVLIDLNVNEIVNDWIGSTTHVTGLVKITSESYFNGCRGVEKINISMGRILIADIGSTQREFNLDVLCSGMSAGTKVPVKVYFDGSSDGAGRLNLEPGGAKGVEISLLNDRGAKLPFSKASAEAMTWTRSEPGGEIYRLPVIAKYAKKSSQKVEAGKANATLNYILEYN